MNDIAELVDLPDPAVQPMVHPLDLPEARRPFRTGWLIGVLSGPAVGIAVGVVAWWLSRNFVVAVVAGASLVAIGTVAGRSILDQAWAYIPRKRQDRRRVLPRALELVAGVVLGASLAVTIVLVAARLAEPDIQPGVRQFVIGSGIVAVVLVLLDLLSGVVLHRGPAARRPWFALPVTVAVVGSAAISYGLLTPDGGLDGSGAALLGALTMAVVGIAALVWQSFAGDRSAKPA
jgi:hypothetical protein